MPDPVLYGYWRSSAAYRVRIALNLKGVSAKTIPVHLRKGEQRAESYRTLNPSGLVPFWREADGFTLGQSLAIIDYLDEIHPNPPFLPPNPRERAICREIAYAIACDIHPLGNLRVVEKLSADFGADSEAHLAWIRHWISLGFAAVEARLVETSGPYAVGARITLADICLAPQVYGARRYGLDLSPFPRIVAADRAARADPAVAAAAPENQPDAE